MIDYQLGAVESRFADIIWENEPISSAELTRRSLEILQWKKSTTYTVLRRLCERGLFQNEAGTVTALVSRAEYDAVRSERFVEESFGGSLPRFLTAFTGRRKLRADEAAALRRMIEEFEE